MKVKDIIKNSALMLGLTDAVEIIEDEQKTELEKLNDETVGTLFRLCQFSVRELCTHYLPILKQVEITTSNKEYPLSSLNNFIKIKSIKFNGAIVDYKIVNRIITFDEDGSFTVEFYAYPTISNIDDEINFMEDYGLDVAVLGLCAYFCLTKGMFEDFDQFHEEYVERAKSIKELKNVNMPQRRWE